MNRMDRHPDRRPLAAAALSIAAVILAQILLHGETLPFPSNGSTIARGTEATAQSTPISEWRKGEIPVLFQIDPQWADAPYSGGTIRENGCGPTCMSMVYVALTGNTDLDPMRMAEWSERNGFSVNGMTAWALMTEGASMLGIHGIELPSDTSVVRMELENGSPIICSVNPGDFTTTGHFIVLAGLTEDGRVIVHDPNSEQNSQRTWELERILSQCANLWSFSI